MRWNQTDIERFDCKVTAPDERGCWNWTSTKTKKGYGTFWIAGARLYAHRVRWVREHGQIPSGLCILHKCDNPSCVNPSHMQTGTKAENNADMWAKGRARPGVHRGEAHGMSRLSGSQVCEIRELRDSGASALALSVRFSVSISQITRIVSRKSWAHLSP